MAYFASPPPYNIEGYFTPMPFRGKKFVQLLHLTEDDGYRLCIVHLAVVVKVGPQRAYTHFLHKPELWIRVFRSKSGYFGSGSRFFFTKFQTRIQCAHPDRDHHGPAYKYSLPTSTRNLDPDLRVRTGFRLNTQIRITMAPRAFTYFLHQSGFWIQT